MLGEGSTLNVGNSQQAADASVVAELSQNLFDESDAKDIVASIGNLRKFNALVFCLKNGTTWRSTKLALIHSIERAGVTDPGLKSDEFHALLDVEVVRQRIASKQPLFFLLHLSPNLRENPTPPTALRNQSVCTFLSFIPDRPAVVRHIRPDGAEQDQDLEGVSFSRIPGASIQRQHDLATPRARRPGSSEEVYFTEDMYNNMRRASVSAFSALIGTTSLRTLINLISGLHSHLVEVHSQHELSSFTNIASQAFRTVSLY